MDSFQITAAVPLSRYWIGLSDEWQEGDFFWGESGTPISPEVAAKFSSGEPNNDGGNEDCVEVHSDHMNDQNCGKRQKFVCQYRVQ